MTHIDAAQQNSDEMSLSDLTHTDATRDRNVLENAQKQLKAASYVKDKLLLQTTFEELITELSEMYERSSDEGLKQEVLQVIADTYSHLLHIEAELQPNRTSVYSSRLQTARKIDALISGAQSPKLRHHLTGQLTTYAGFAISTAIRFGYASCLTDALSLQFRVNQRVEELLEVTQLEEDSWRLRKRLAAGYMSLSILMGRCGQWEEQITAANRSISYFDELQSHTNGADGEYGLAKRAGLYQDIAKASRRLGEDSKDVIVVTFHNEQTLAAAQKSIDMYKQVIHATKDSLWRERYTNDLAFSQRLVDELT